MDQGFCDMTPWRLVNVKRSAYILKVSAVQPAPSAHIVKNFLDTSRNLKIDTASSTRRQPSPSVSEPHILQNLHVVFPNQELFLSQQTDIRNEDI